MNPYGQKFMSSYKMVKRVFVAFTTFYLSPDFIAFWQCDAIEWYNKFNMSAYLLNFVAIALAYFGLIWNLVWFEYYYRTIPILLMPTNLLIEGMIFWTVLCMIINLLFCSKAKFKHDVVAAQQLRESIFTGILYGSISARFFKMYIQYLYGSEKVEFKTTSKDCEGAFQLEENFSKWLQWLKQTRVERYMYGICFILMVSRLVLPQYIHDSTYLYNKSVTRTFYFGCLPIILQIFFYLTGPVFFDHLMKLSCIYVDRKTSEEEQYDASRVMFKEGKGAKYRTAIVSFWEDLDEKRRNDSKNPNVSLSSDCGKKDCEICAKVVT